MGKINPPDAESCVLPYILERFARESPDKLFAVFANGEEWNYAEASHHAKQVAAGLSRLGVKTGDKVITWLPNSPLSVKCWFGINYAGAVFVAINSAYKGGILQHVIENSDAEVIICHPDLASRLLGLESCGRLKLLITADDFVARDAGLFNRVGLKLCGFSSLESAIATADFPVKGLQPWSMQSICYTSGTTGPSKGVMSSYLHLFTMSVEFTYGIEATDRHLINLPLFHAGGTLYIYGALARGAQIAVIGGFSTEEFLPTCKRMQVTACILLGAMANFLLRRPPSAADRDHSLRRVMVIPLSEDARDMSNRFGFDVITGFNMTEISGPIKSEENPTERGSCGRLRDGVDARVVDENDCEVPVGEVGELVLRADCPWTMSHGYYKMPEATAKAWRNGWFHTGDAFRVNSEGYFFFVDRVKDAIRRRGENISSFEVEAEVVTFPGVLEAAAIGVPSEFGEEEVMIVVANKPDHTIDNAELIEFLRERMAHFMVPRYVRHVATLPKTPTTKVEKHILRAEGITTDTWDREKAGIRVRRENQRS